MRVILAEDSVLLRAGLVRLLTEGGFEVAAAVGDAEQLLAAVDRIHPQLVVADVRMPPTFTDEGIRAALRIRAEQPGVAILVLSQYVEQQYASELLADNSGAVGYLLKDRVADVSQFLAAARQVGEGGTVMDAEVVAALFARSRRRDPLAALSPRERQVLGLMAEGKSNAAIAADLFITDRAVEKHVSNIFSKLNLAPADSAHRRVLAVLRWLEA